MDKGNNQPRRVNAKTKAQAKKRPKSSNQSANWLNDHLALVVVICLAILVGIVLLVSLLTGGGESPESRPDSSGPIEIGDLELNIHQWNCGLTSFERLDNPEADPIQAAEGSHFCTLAVQASNRNLDKFRAFDPSGQRIVFRGNEYVYHAVATRNGLGANSGVRVLAPGIGIEDGTVPPLINMVFEIPQDEDGSEIGWRGDSILIISDSSDPDQTKEIPLKDYDKQS